MPDRIIIDFDGEEKEPDKDAGQNSDKRSGSDEKEKERIVIEFDETPEEHIEEVAEESYEETFIKSKINCFYKGNSYLNNSFNSRLKFPEGIDHSFRIKFSKNLKDEFFNSILQNNRYIILSSRKGNIYFIDRFTGFSERKLSFEDESFEKTGLVYENTIYLNSLSKIFCIKESDDGEIVQNEIYKSPDGYFIWSNLNRHKNFIVFTEYNISEGNAFIKILNTESVNPVYDFEFRVKDFISDKVCITEGKAFMLFDNKILTYDIDKLSANINECEINTDENSFIFYLNYRLYITSQINELFYIDLPAVNYKFKTTGIRNPYINSIGGFADNILMGTLDGWKIYKSSGLQIYYFEDEYENKIESISKNILVISQSNKIIFCNLNRFQEAEGYVISSDGNPESNDPVEIISAIIADNEIFVLTKSGILEAYTSDKMNIHI
ncbi:MAG: hypothetical protein KDD00_11435 [Ignavibacteriae bacterium]|nr:hypothetical protein [Ignavibacteriota bacterium]